MTASGQTFPLTVGKIWGKIMTSPRETMHQSRCDFHHLICIDILHPYAKYKKIVGTVSEKINKLSIFGQKYDVIDPKKGDPMHQSRRGFHHLIAIDVPFHLAKYKKNCRSRFWKNWQSWFSSHTYRQTYRLRVSYRTFPCGGSKKCACV